MFASNPLVTSLLAFTLLAPASALDFEKVFAAKPSLRNAKPIPVTTRNKNVAASSVLSVMNSAHPTGGANTVRVTQASSSKPKKSKTKTATAKGKGKKTKSKTGKAKTGKSKTGKAKTGKAKTTKSAAKKPLKQSAKHKKKPAHKHHARDTSSCTPQNIMYGYTPNPNSPTGFLVDNVLGTSSSSALPPAGYSNSFIGAYGSVSANGYIGFYQLPKYNISQCSAFCDSTSGCAAFNIYHERDPVLDPGLNCPQPNASVAVRCALWGNPISSAQATNVGEWRTNFMVIVSGSNGYNKNTPPATVSNFSAPIALAAAVDSGSRALTAGQYLGYTFSPAAAFNASFCANYCQATTAQNKAAAVQAGAATYSACNWFNAFLTTYNSTSQGMYCQAFSSDASTSATQYSQVVNGVTYGFTYSYAYALSSPDNGIVNPSTATSSVPTSSVPASSGPASSVPVSSVSTAATVAPVSSSVTSSASSAAAVTPSSSTTSSSAQPSTITAATTPVVTGVGADGYTTTTFPPVCSSAATDIYAMNDPNNVSWLYMCGGGSAGTAYAQPVVNTDWSGCFALCGNLTDCTGFSYVNGPANGKGAGNCWLKNANPQSFASTTSLLTTRIGAIIRSYTTSVSTTAAAAVTTTAAATTNAAATTAASTPKTSTSTSTSTNTAAAAIASAASASAGGSGGATGSADVCPKSNFTTYVDSNSVKYTIYCGFDATPGSDLGTVNAANMTLCLASCDATPGCVSVTLAGTACYKRSSYSGRTANANAVSAVLYNPKPYPRAAVGSSAGSSGCGLALPAGLSAGGKTVSLALPYQGINRTYNIHIPSYYDINTPSPLIFGFHGKGEQGGNFEGYSGLSNDGINPYGIMIYPDGVNGVWQSDPSTIGTNPYIDDQSWVTALVGSLSSSFCIDRKRIWGTGFSNGGGFIGVLACNSSISATFSAFAAHSGALYTKTSASACTAGVPDTVLTNNIVESVCSPGVATLPFLEFHGDNDNVINYLGGPRQNQCLPSIPHYINDWATRDGLGTTNITSAATANVNLTQFGSGNSLGVVSHYKIGGWGHAWSSKAAGASIDASTIVMDFFYKQTPA